MASQRSASWRLPAGRSECGRASGRPWPTLRRHISDRVAPSPPTRRSRPIGPGGHSGNDSHILRGRRNPGTRHFGISHSRTQNEPTPRPEITATGSNQRALRTHPNPPLDTRGIARCPVMAPGQPTDSAGELCTSTATAVASEANPGLRPSPCVHRTACPSSRTERRRPGLDG